MVKDLMYFFKLSRTLHRLTILFVTSGIFSLQFRAAMFSITFQYQIINTGPVSFDFHLPTGYNKATVVNNCNYWKNKKNSGLVIVRIFTSRRNLTIIFIRKDHDLCQIKRLFWWDDELELYRMEPDVESLFVSRRVEMMALSLCHRYI